MTYIVRKMRMNRISISSRDEGTGMREDERKLEMVQTKRRVPKKSLGITKRRWKDERRVTRVTYPRVRRIRHFEEKEGEKKNQKKSQENGQKKNKRTF